jgi:hypothetical protein
MSYPIAAAAATFATVLRPQPVLPTGRNFGRKTQKWPFKYLSGRKKQRPNFSPISQKMAEKWPNFFGMWTSHKGLDYVKK